MKNLCPQKFIKKLIITKLRMKSCCKEEQTLMGSSSIYGITLSHLYLWPLQ